MTLTVRSTARRFIARWKEGRVQLTVPPGATMADVRRAIAEMAPRLIAARSKTTQFEFDRDYDYELLSFRLLRVEDYGRRCTVHETAPHRFEIHLDAASVIDSSEVIAVVSRQIKNIAKYVGRSVLIDEAARVAASVGVRPVKWQLASGSRVLGRCNSRGVITLSAMLVFLPGELRRYVMCHELAHLSEMNHSERFHTLCNRYCGGREREFQLSLKRFRLPC